MNSNSYEEDLNEITPLLLSNEQSNNESNETNDQSIKSVRFPIKFTIFNSTCLILLNIAMIVCECIQSDHFSLEDLSVVSYKTLNGFILWTSIIMLIYTVVSLLNGK